MPLRRQEVVTASKMLVESVTELAVVRLIIQRKLRSGAPLAYNTVVKLAYVGICKAKLVCSASCHADMREYATLGECSLTYSCRAGRVR